MFRNAGETRSDTFDYSLCFLSIKKQRDSAETRCFCILKACDARVDPTFTIAVVDKGPAVFLAVSRYNGPVGDVGNDVIIHARSAPDVEDRSGSCRLI